MGKDKKNIGMLILILILFATSIYGVITIRNDNKEIKKIKEMLKPNMENNGDDILRTENEFNKNVNIVDEDNVLYINDKNYVKFIKTEAEPLTKVYEIMLNGKKHTVSIKFDIKYFEEVDKNSSETPHSGSISAKFQGITIFSEENYGHMPENYYYRDHINYLFNLDNFKLIKGLDNKYYLGIISHLFNSETPFIYRSLTIYNDKLENITKNEMDKPIDLIVTGAYYFKPNTKDIILIGHYSKNTELCGGPSCQITLKMENDKIYNWYSILNNDFDSSRLEEREYVINNNKLEYKVLQTKVFATAGSAAVSENQMDN